MEITLSSFFEHRQRLLAESTVTRVAIDKWYEARKDREADLRELALLEGCSQTGRRYLEILMKLDEDMLSRLIAHRTSTLEGG